MKFAIHQRAGELLARTASSSLSKQIGFGFAIVLVLHAAVAALSHVGLEAARSRRGEIQLETAALQATLRHDRNLVALQRDVLSFMYTGSESLALNVEADIETFSASLAGASSHPQDPVHQAMQREMLEALERYRLGFASVVKDRAGRDELLEGSVRPFATRFRAELVGLLGDVELGKNSEAVAETARTLRWFTECSEDLNRYVGTPSGRLAQSYSTRYSSLSKSLERLEAHGVTDALPSAGELDAWYLNGLSVINRTRSFLHLVNVVLMGEALEFRTLSSRLTVQSREHLEQVTASVTQKQGRFSQLSAGFGILTILAGVIAGWWISRSVSEPIRAITETFSRLAKGDRVAVVGRERSDEIGEMARAAEVFAERNRETSQLLSASRRQAREQSVTNASLEEHVRELRQRNEDLDSFSYSASHDLKAPLRSVSLLASWIEEDEDNHLSEESAEYLVVLKSRTQRLEGLLEGLLEYARVGRSEDLSESLSVKSVVEQTLDSLSGDRSTTFSISGEDVTIEAPRVALQKCIQNLVSNSIEHHDGANPVIEIVIERVGENARVTVIDDGPGIAPSLHEKVFGIFQTVKRRDENESSGIGLAIVDRLARSHGVEIQVDSDGVRGCAISLLWPIKNHSSTKVIPRPDEHGAGPSPTTPDLASCA